MIVDAESSVECNIDANGYLEVSVKAGGGTGGTSITDDAAFTAGTTAVNPVGGVFTADTVDAGDAGALAMDASRRLLVSIEVDNVGIGGGTQYTEADTDATITGNVTMWEDTGDAIVAASAAKPFPIDIITDTAGIGGGTQYAEDAAHFSGNTGTMALAVRADTAAATAADGDYVPLLTDANGRLHTLDQNSADMLTALQIIDDWDDANYCNVNLNVAGTDVAGNAGVLSAQTLRVTIATDDECNNYLGTIDADTSNMATSLGNLDDSVDGNYLNTNMNIAGTDVSANSGTLDAQTQRVTIATDDECNNLLGTIDADTGAIKTAIELLDNAVYVDDADWSDSTSSHLLVGGLYQSTPQTVTDGDVAPLEIDVNGKLIESNSADMLTALQIIDDWDDANYCNVNLNVAGTDVSGNAGTLDAQTLRVTIATDDEVNNLLGTIDADTSSLAGAVSGSEIQVDIVADGAGLATSAKQDTLETTLTNIETAVQIIDDWDSSDSCKTVGSVAHDTADSGNPVKIGAKAVNFDGTAPPNRADTEDDRVNIIADRYGRQFIETTHPNYWDVSADYAAAQTNATIKAAPGASLSLYITDILISNGATAGNITLLDGSGGTVKWEIYPAANGGCVSNLRSPIKLTANTLLAVTSATVTTHSVTITGYTAP